MSWLSSRLSRVGAAARGGVYGAVLRYLGGLRFPAVFFLAATLFVMDLIVPDVIPFADEILLGLVTILIGRVRRPHEVARDS